MKATIKKLVQEAVYEETEIIFPFYRKHANMYYYYAISESQVISACATDRSTVVEIEVQPLVIGNVFHKDSEEITKEEFEAKFNQAIEVLTNLKNK